MRSQIIELYSLSCRGPKIALLKFILSIEKGLKMIFLWVLQCILDVLKDTVLILRKVIAASCPIVQWSGELRIPITVVPHNLKYRKDHQNQEQT